MKKSFLFSLFLFLMSTVISQDLHFSQFYNVPVALNPGKTGMFNEDYRISGVYRNQWKQAHAGFNSMGIAGEMNFPVDRLAGDRIGVGLLAYNDKLGDGIMYTESVMLSVSYWKAIDREKRHKLSVGFQGGYVEKGIDYSSLFFGNQINNYQYDPNIASNEGMGQRFRYFNLNAGLFYTWKVSENLQTHAGISFFNITNPKESFLGLQNATLNKLKNRSATMIGFNWVITDKISLMPDLLIMRQTKAMDLNFGTAVGYSLSGRSNKNQIMAGMYYRTTDAVIFMAGLKLKNNRVGISYDLTSSSFLDIKTTPQVNDNARIGAFEITFIHSGFIPRMLPNDRTVPCGFF